jgi:hypothetical protein
VRHSPGDFPFLPPGRRIIGGNMSDMPLWFRLTIYVTVGATVLYAAWGFLHSML